MKTRGIIFVAVTVAAVLVAAWVVLAVATLRFAAGPWQTLPVELRVSNDTQIGITITGCITPSYSSPGEFTSVFAVLHSSTASCIVLQTSTGDYLGCLPTPTTRYHNGDTVRASGYLAEIPESDCGSY